MKVLIAEDHKSSLKLLKYLIRNLSEYKVVGEAKDGEELLKSITTLKPDLALVDIGLPLLSGMDAVKACVEIHPSLQVIFITGSEDYAVEAFNMRATDYILKPIDTTRLYAALERASANYNQYHEIGKKVNHDLVIKQNQSIIFIPFNEIIFIERVERKSVIHAVEAQYETYDSLSKLEENLDSRFMSCHRSYIINLDFLSIIESSGQSYKAYFKNYNKSAKVSKSKLTDLQKMKTN